MNTENYTGTTDLPSNLSKVFLSLSWIDYLLFTVMFGLSTVIGVYYGCFGNKQSTTTDYLHGGKKMKIFPVAMSLMASSLSGISLVGIPSEIYMHGTQYSMCMLSAIIMVVIVSNIYLPVFHKLQLNSTFEYLKMRFSNKIHIIASFLYILTSFLCIPLVIYVPALAFNQVTGIDIYVITPIISIVCIFYTTLGGLKAVVWTDTLQFSVTLLTLAFVLIMGTVSVGGFGTVWEKSAAGGRLEFFNMDPDPTLRASFWSVVIGHVFSWVSAVGCNPAFVQRFMAVPSIGQAKKSLIILAGGIIVTKAICCFSGLIMYARYYDCDPLTSGSIKKSDQILPYYVLDVGAQIPGLSGLFVAGVFSTALSTLSTYLNSLSGIVYTDFIAPLMSKDTTEATASNIMKLLVVILGALCVALVFVVEKMGSVLEMSISLGGTTAGPLLGLFTMGMLFPFANEKGAICGGLSSLLLLAWVVVKKQLHNYNGTIKHLHKSLYVYGCSSGLNATSVIIENITTIMSPYSSYGNGEPFWFFRVSFYYYPVIGTILTIVIGVLVSWLTSRKDGPPVNSDLLCPYIHRFISESTNTDQHKIVEEALNVTTLREIGELESLNNRVQ